MSLPAIPPRPARNNPLTTRTAWETARQACQTDPGHYHGDIARQQLHWYIEPEGQDAHWLTYNPDTNHWQGYHTRTGEPAQPPLPPASPPGTPPSTPATPPSTAGSAAASPTPASTKSTATSSPDTVGKPERGFQASVTHPLGAQPRGRGAADGQD